MRNISVSLSTPQYSLQPGHPLVLLACLKLLPLITVVLLLSQFVRSIAGRMWPGMGWEEDGYRGQE